MRKFYLILSLAFLFLLGCENHLEMTLPQGPQGEQGEKGDKGEDGLSAFELWKILYGKDPNTPMEDFFNSLRGKDGKDGAVPVIGENGNWIIDGTDTGIPATGKDGKDGVTPVIGENDNWFIDGVDTGVPARGKDGNTPEIGEDGNWVIGDINTGIPAKGEDGSDGEDGKEGLTPEIGENGNWVIGDFDTGIPAEGKDGADGQDGADGEDGITPEIGENGNWIIGDYDTGVPAEGKDGADGEDGQDGKDGNTPRIDEDGYWVIGDFETGIPATGKDGADGQDGNHGNDGVDGKSAFELWVEGVENGTITNKDGSIYEGGNTWEDFLRWLQGGDISVLHQHWLSLGNTGDLDAFIEALFDCHCDGVSIAIVADNPCIELNADGTVAKTYNAKLIVSAEAGTEVNAFIEGGQNFTKTVATGQSQVEFNFARGDENKTVTILAKPAGETEQVTKIAQIPALKYVKFGSASVVEVDGEEKDNASITFESAPVELYVNTVLVYDKDGVVEGSGWEVSADGKSFTKTYERGASKHKLSFRAVGDDDACSILTGLLEIPQLTPVEVNDPTVVVGDCDVTVTLTGTTDMTVIATASNDQSNPKTMTQSPAGTYTASFPRKYGAYTIEILAGKTGAGNVTKTVSIDGNKLLPTPFTYSFVGGGTSNTDNPVATGSFTNPTSNPIVLEISRSGNTVNSAEERSPWVEGSPGITTTKEVTIPASETVDLKFHRDVAPNFARGTYTVTIKTTSQCGEPFSKTQVIHNQRDFRHGFRKVSDATYPGGGGSSPGQDPEYPKPTPEEGYTIFEVTVEDAIPGSYVQFILSTSQGDASVWGAGKVTDDDGNLKILVKMKDSDIAIANQAGTGQFRFSDKSVGGEPFHTKDVPFNLPMD